MLINFFTDFINITKSEFLVEVNCVVFFFFFEKFISLRNRYGGTVNGAENEFVRLSSEFGLLRFQMSFRKALIHLFSLPTMGEIEEQTRFSTLGGPRRKTPD